MFRCSLALVLAASCVGDDGRDDEPPLSDDGHASVSVSTSLATPLEHYDMCAHLPAEPPCSLICDHDALVEYVPDSSCAVFVCVLTDGVQVSVHACHPPS
jgi:hypothetical protein